MPLPNTPGVYIYNGYNCTPTLLPTAASIPVSPQDSTTVASKLGTVEQNISELSSEVQAKADLADLSEVATSGSYTDLVDTPTIPIVDTQLNPNSNNAIANSVVAAVRDLIYPVGSIYLSVTDSTVATVEARFGGTWERISEGRALFGYSTTDTDFQTIGSGGGNKAVNLQHTHGFASNAVVGSTTLTGRQSGIQQHKHTVATNAEYEVSNNGKATDAITGGGHTHTFNTYIQNAADEAHGYTLVGGGGFYDRCIVTSSINRIYATSNTHKHDLPNHSHTVSLKSGKGLTLNNTGHTDALDSHNHSLSSVNTGNGLSTTQNILNPYITVYMYKRTA